MKTITILGSTGSIGVNTLDVVAQNLGDFKVYALTAHTNIKRLYQQCLEFSPVYAVVATEDLKKTLQSQLENAQKSTIVLAGAEALVSVSGTECVDMVMAAIVGIAGLMPSYAAARKGKTILLANKESLVTAGHIFMQAVKESGAILLPVDSEHNAIFQCLPSADKAYNPDAISKIILTASGGPFRTKTLDELKTITPEQACAHPNWEMGRKISVDSSTMMNKALEVIEAYWLFDVPGEQIEVLIHPQSIVHSMVAYHDGSFLAQLGSPDMRTPIAYSMYYPKRHKVEVPKLDFVQTQLTFEKVDNNRFAIMALVFTILKNKDYSAAIVLNAANEILVDAFLAEKIQYLQIIQYIEYTLQSMKFDRANSIDEVIKIDQEVRRYVEKLVTDAELKKTDKGRLA